MGREVDVKAIVSHIVRGDGTDKCRICMGDTSKGLVYLDDPVINEGEKNVTLAELLETITGIEVFEDDLFPKGVCVQCLNSAIAAYEFKKLVLSSKEIWHKVIHALGSITTGAATPARTICAFLRTDTISIQSIKDYSNGDPITLLNKLKKTSSKFVRRKKPKIYQNGPNSTCSDCGKTYPNPFLLSVHLKNSGQKDACALCGVITLRGKEMKKHLMMIHGKNSYICPECPALFLNEANYTEHNETAHKPGAMTCSDCGRTFTRSNSFETHSQMHAVRTCRVCEKQFTNRGCYRTHRALCEPNAKLNRRLVPLNQRSNIRDPATFICDYCGKTYNSRPQLKNHIIWIHMGVRPYECQWCRKRFYTPSRLSEHSVVHTRVRNFECDICGMKLVSKMAAVYHRRRHTGERPYVCDDCGETFISSSRRSEHAKRKHGKGQMYCCLQCPMTFIRGIYLKKHIQKAHPKPILMES